MPGRSYFLGSDAREWAFGVEAGSKRRCASLPSGRRPARPPLRGGIAEKGARPETVGPRRFSGRSLRGPLERKREKAGLRGAKLRPVIVRSRPSLVRVENLFKTLRDALHRAASAVPLGTPTGVLHSLKGGGVGRHSEIPAESWAEKFFRTCRDS